jgi:hypothetical protein
MRGLSLEHNSQLLAGLVLEFKRALRNGTKCNVYFR